MTAHSNAVSTLSNRPDTTSRLGLLGLAQRAAAGLMDTYLEWSLRRATVRLLNSLDDRALGDIGMSRSEIHSAVYGEAGARVRAYQSGWV